jgi:hypothetical protein
MFLANMEAVLGSFYLAIVVARLVSIYDLNKDIYGTKDYYDYYTRL